MITTATATSARKTVKYEEHLDSDESANFEEEDEEESDAFEDVNISKLVWKMQMLISQSFIKHGVIFLQPLMSEILEKWFARIHKTKRSKRLCIGQLMEQFFKDENGVMW